MKKTIIQYDVTYESNLKRSLEKFLDTVVFLAVINILWMVFYIDYYGMGLVLVHFIPSYYLIFNVYKIRQKEDKFNNIRITIYFLLFLVSLSIIYNGYIHIIKVFKKVLQDEIVNYFSPPPYSFFFAKNSIIYKSLYNYKYVCYNLH